MFELILAGSFIAMILTPSLVAAVSGKKELEPEIAATGRSNSSPRKTVAVTPSKLLRVAPPVRRNFENPDSHIEPATLPMRRTLGMAGR